MRDSLPLLKSIPVLMLAFGALTITGCDDDSSATDPDPDSETTISGRVTDDSGFSKAGDVDDADVRAEEIDEDGNRSPSSGETTTDSDGRYSLKTDADARVMIVTATKGDFSSETIVVNHVDSDAVAAMDMNAETRAEARVYTEAKRMDDSAQPVTAADVAMYVDAETATRIESNNSSDAEVATALHSAVKGELMYLSDANVSSSQIESASNAKIAAFAALQADIAAGSGTSGALDAFASTMADVYVDAGVDHTTSAEARQTASLVITNLSGNLDSSARLAMRKRAELMAGLSTAAAIEAEFRAEGGMESEANAIESAGITLAASIAGASTDAEIEDAWAAFESETKAQLSAGITLGAALLQTVEASLLSLKTSFKDSIAAASSVDTVVELKAEYHADARVQIQNDLSTLANAEFAARVLTLASAH
ncbi:MAG: carboxypeptidase regulatory-like domain-containing protein [Rhodothermales bacterium]|nr:carboxypeptidase regulatory-like domain-containing protein [Rhodothermales bacterium]